MTYVNIITTELVDEGTRESNVVNVPVGATQISVMIPRKDLLDSSVAVALQLFLSMDGGTSWKPHGGGGTVGGEVINSETQQVEPYSGITMGLPEPNNTQRKIMATVTTTAQVKVGLDIEFK